jgi:hypothetical protein
VSKEEEYRQLISQIYEVLDMGDASPSGMQEFIQSELQKIEEGGAPEPEKTIVTFELEPDDFRPIVLGEKKFHVIKWDISDDDCYALSWSNGMGEPNVKEIAFRDIRDGDVVSFKLKGVHFTPHTVGYATLVLGEPTGHRLDLEGKWSSPSTQLEARSDDHHGVVVWDLGAARSIFLTEHGSGDDVRVIMTPKDAVKLAEILVKIAAEGETVFAIDVMAGRREIQG